MIVGARRLPLHHITIRLPWHDGGWAGTVCSRPLDNSSCLILPQVSEGRRDEDGGGPNGTLIETRDELGGGLDAAAIASLIDDLDLA